MLVSMAGNRTQSIDVRDVTRELPRTVARRQTRRIAKMVAGATLVGARKPLVAYNLILATDSVEAAREIAAVVRESGGGLPGVQAIGLRLPRSGLVQVSMNVLDLDRTPLHDAVERVRVEARRRGIEIADGELVGLVPESVYTAARAAGVDVPGVDEGRVLERALPL